jgi:hypothetical protein
MVFIFLFLYHGWNIPFLFLKDRIQDVHQLSLDETIKYRLFFSLSLMYFFLIFGIAITKKIFKFRIREIINYAEKPIKYNKGIYPTVLLYFIVVMIFASYYFTKTSVFPGLIKYFSSIGDETKIKLLRQLSNPENLGIVGYLFGWSLWVFCPLLSLILLSLWLYKKKISFKIWSFLVILITTILTLSGKSKFPPVHFLVTLIFFILIWEGKIKIFKNKQNLILILLFVYGVSTLLYFMVVGSFSKAMFYVFKRIAEGPNYALLLHFKYFPDTVEFLGGRDIRLVSKIMDWEYISSPALLSKLAFGKQGNANAMFISGLWVNFGYWGIIIGSFLLGIYLQWIQIWLVRRNKTITNVVLFSYLTIQVWHLANISIFPAIFSFGLVTGPILVRIIEIFNDIFAVVSRKTLYTQIGESYANYPCD